MTMDLNKKITDISFNVLNLPSKLVIDSITHTYTYAADGRKLRVQQGEDKRDYAGSIIYEDSSLKRILVDSGYAQKEGDNWIYHFYFNDHLGNNVVVADQDGNAIQNNSYYPFGLPMATASDSIQGLQPYKYNGKEFEQKDGLRLYDYGARHYDAQVGRFTTVDPIAEKYYATSPYAYCLNNPMKYVDPTGMNPEDGPRKDLNPELTDYVKLFFGYLLQLMGMHPSQTNSEDPYVQEEAKQRRENTIEVLHTVNESLLTPISAGGLSYKVITKQELTEKDIAIGVAELLPLVFLTKGKKIVNNLVKIITKEDDVIIFSAKFGTETVEGISNYAVKGNKLHLDKLHLQGSEGGNIGVSNLFEMARDLGRQHNVQEVIIQGGMRTTGKYKGTVPSPITIKVN